MSKNITITKEMIIQLAFYARNNFEHIVGKRLLSFGAMTDDNEYIPLIDIDDFKHITSSSSKEEGLFVTSNPITFIDDDFISLVMNHPVLDEVMCLLSNQNELDDLIDEEE